MTMLIIVMLSCLLMGCQAHTQKNISPSPLLGASFPLYQANHFEPGPIKEEKETTEESPRKVLFEEKTQRQMAKIIEKAIVQERRSREDDIPEEIESGDKKLIAKTWLERGRTFLEMKHYGEALEAAEQVFVYDPDNREASYLIDDVKKRAYREGKAESLILRSAVQEEVQERVQRYWGQVRTWMEAGYWNAARMAVEKILVLKPEDPEASRLHKQIQAQMRG